jgi:hypothetical protein
MNFLHNGIRMDRTSGSPGPENFGRPADQRLEGNHARGSGPPGTWPRSGGVGGTASVLLNLLPRLGVSTSLVDQIDPEAFEKALTPQTRLILLESPSNPLGCATPADRPASAGGFAGRASGVNVARDAQHDHGVRCRIADNCFTSSIDSPPSELFAPRFGLLTSA